MGRVVRLWLLHAPVCAGGCKTRVIFRRSNPSSNVANVGAFFVAKRLQFGGDLDATTLAHDFHNVALHLGSALPPGDLGAIASVASQDADVSLVLHVCHEDGYKFTAPGAGGCPHTLDPSACGCFHHVGVHFDPSGLHPRDAPTRQNALVASDSEPEGVCQGPTACVRATADAALKPLLGHAAVVRLHTLVALQLLLKRSALGRGLSAAPSPLPGCVARQIVSSAPGPLGLRRGLQGIQGSDDRWIAPRGSAGERLGFLHDTGQIPKKTSYHPELRWEAR